MGKTHIIKENQTLRIKDLDKTKIPDEEIKKIDKVEERYIVSKSNILIDAIYTLTANEQKILISVISLLNSQNAEDYSTYRVSVSALRELLKINSKDFYRQVKVMTMNILSKPFFYYDKEENKTLQGAWFSTCEYLDNEGVVEFEFSPKVKKLLLGLKKNFTSYMLGYAVSLKSRFSIRLYELLKRVEKIKSAVFLVEELKTMLGIDDKYEKYNHFKSRVLDKSKEEINRYTDIKFKYDELKAGKKVERIKFFISENRKNINTISEPDIFGLNELSVLLEKYGISRNKTLELINEYEDGYIRDRIKRFEFEKNDNKKKVEEIGAGKYLYNLITHTDWKNDKYEVHKLSQSKKKQEEEKRKESKRIEKLKEEYDEYVDSMMPSFDELSPGKQKEIKEHIESELSKKLGHFTLKDDTIAQMRFDLQYEMIKEEKLKELESFEEWISKR